MKKHKQGRRPHNRIVQNFLIIWLDENIDEEKNTDCQNTIAKLREVANSINTFTDVDECIDFITDIKVERVFMITSAALGETTAPMVRDTAQVSSIYILCKNKTVHEQWTQQWPKVKGVFTDVEAICKTLTKAVHECDQNTISMSFVATNDDSTYKNPDALDQSFMYTQIIKEILLTIDFEPQHFREFVAYCRKQFNGCPSELHKVDELDSEYSRHTPIWWYTSPWFLYSMLNRALRTMEVDLIIILGFYLSDLHQHITQLHSEQYSGQTHSASFVVYRGQGLSETDFDQLVKTKDGLLSFNNFLSTSFDRTVSLAFAESNQYDPDLKGILFEITVNTSISSTAFANVEHVSYYQDECEILFSMHSIFRIGKIEKIDENDKLWTVELILTGDHDPQMHALTEYIREETFSGYKGWYRLGYLLIKLGQFDKAQQVYDIMLTRVSDDQERANIYHMLGMVKDGQGEYEQAITSYEESNEIIRKISPVDHPDLARSYCNIGGMNFKIAEYAKAISFYEKALEIFKKTLPDNHPDLAGFYNNIGMIFFTMNEDSKALSSYEKALEIFKNTLPSNHPHLASLYNNIGVLYEKMDEYSKAFSSHEKALEIRQNTLPPNHPDLAESYNNIGNVYCSMEKYSDALSFLGRALHILQGLLPADHPNLITLQTNIDFVKEKLSMIF